MQRPEISVIVPIFRIEKYLPECIESLIDQSFTNFELILVDDGSPDNCPKICDQYASRDSRIVVIHKENGGLLSARKAGLDQAIGEFIAFVDGDDWVDKYYLDVLYKLAINNYADLVITGHFREFDGKIETIKPKQTGVFNETEIKEEILPNAIYNGKFCEHGISTYVWNKLFRKTILEKVLYEVPNDIIMGEDAAITYSALPISKSVVISKIPVYYYRQRHDSIVKSIENPKMEYYRLGLLMNFLKTKLKEALPLETIDKQLTYYLYSQILVRSGGMIYDDKGNLICNPFMGVTSNCKVIVYSSGSFGQHILSTNAKYNFFSVTRWIDLDYHNLSIGGNSVQPISTFNNEEFDYLIIATINPTTYKAISEELCLMGIKKEKIVKINVNLFEINDLLNQLGFDNEFRFQNS